MKELSVKEKAKRYDEAIEELRGLLEGVHEEKCEIMEEDIIKIFPELKESEDEKIELLNYLYDVHDDDEERARWIAWLEKQGEKDEEILILKDQIESLHAAIKAIKETHRIELEKQGEKDMIPLDKAIKFLDEQLVNDKDEVTGEPFINFQNYGAFKETFISYFKRKMLKKQGEQKYMKTCAEYYNQDNEWKMPELSEFQDKLADILMHREYDGPDETEDDIAKGRLEYELAAIRLSEELLPLAQKEQSVPKPAWSEKDDEMLNQVIEDIVKLAGPYVCYHKDVDWLKSLRHKNQWKPSDEQMKALTHLFDGHLVGAKLIPKDYDNLRLLLEQLKKLRE